jgi:hypothetical protein
LVENKLGYDYFSRNLLFFAKNVDEQKIDTSSNVKNTIITTLVIVVSILIILGVAYKLFFKKDYY